MIWMESLARVSERLVKVPERLVKVPESLVKVSERLVKVSERLKSVRKSRKSARKASRRNSNVAKKYKYLFNIIATVNSEATSKSMFKDQDFKTYLTKNLITDLKNVGIKIGPIKYYYLPPQYSNITNGEFEVQVKCTSEDEILLIRNLIKTLTLYIKFGFTILNLAVISI